MNHSCLDKKAYYNDVLTDCGNILKKYWKMINTVIVDTPEWKIRELTLDSFNKFFASITDRLSENIRASSVSRDQVWLGGGA